MSKKKISIEDRVVAMIHMSFAIHELTNQTRREASKNEDKMIRDTAKDILKLIKKK